jgi:mannose-6-phosphate isomerase-like protein (cupin superfamily)
VAEATGRGIRDGPTNLQRVVQVKTTPKKVDKPWGYELHWADTERYVGKVLHIDEGEALSLQYHEVKDETIHVLQGSLRFEVGPSAEELEEVVLEAGAGYRIEPGTVHRMIAVTDCDILEVSTPHLDDLVRLEDRYGRSGTRAP